MDIMDKSKIPFRPVGERFNLGNVVLEVVPDANFDCKSCYFHERVRDTRGDITSIRHCGIHAFLTGHCAAEDREDGEDIIFRQVK